MSNAMAKAMADILLKALPPEIMALVSQENIERVTVNIKTFIDTQNHIHGAVTDVANSQTEIHRKLDEVLAYVATQKDLAPSVPKPRRKRGSDDSSDASGKLDGGTAVS